MFLLNIWGSSSHINLLLFPKAKFPDVELLGQRISPVFLQIVLLEGTHPATLIS